MEGCLGWGCDAVVTRVPGRAVANGRRAARRRPRRIKHRTPRSEEHSAPRREGEARGPLGLGRSAVQRPAHRRETHRTVRTDANGPLRNPFGTFGCGLSRLSPVRPSVVSSTSAVSALASAGGAPCCCSDWPCRAVTVSVTLTGVTSRQGQPVRSRRDTRASLSLRLRVHAPDANRVECHVPHSV
jgi:hypothetical protein